MKPVLKHASLLAAFTLLAAGAIALVHSATRARIEQQERAALESQLQALVPPERYDNRMYADCTRVTDPELLGSKRPVTVYRARKAGQDVAAILEAVAPDGYVGAIHLRVGIYRDGRLAGVRVTEHKETPGLGNKIEAERSDWILGFAGKSAAEPAPARWDVTRNGGEFDAFTGASITPRAVVKAVYKSLEYFARHQDALFAAPNECEE